ncbi:MAG: hypothetical protein AAFU67_00750 [Bacteroidota bacterium]
MIEKELIKFAVCAPSGHNSQPWKFKVNPNRIEIHPDFNHTLPNVDPHNRELYISLGCAGENIQVASGHFGYESNWSLQKDANNVKYIAISLNDKGVVNSNRNNLDIPIAK